MGYNDKPRGRPYRPDYISRKMFDIYQDRLDRRVARIKEDYRADIAALVGRVQNLEQLWDKLFPVEEHQQLQHEIQDRYEQLPDGRWRRKASTEGL